MQVAADRVRQMEMGILDALLRLRQPNGSDVDITRDLRVQR